MNCFIFTPYGPKGVLSFPRAPSDGSNPSTEAINLSGLYTSKPVIRIRSNGAFWINFGNGAVSAAGRTGTYIEAETITILGIPEGTTHFAVSADKPGQFPANQTLYYSSGY